MQLGGVLAVPDGKNLSLECDVADGNHRIMLRLCARGQISQDAANAPWVGMKLMNAVLKGLGHVRARAEFAVQLAAQPRKGVARGLVHIEDDVLGRCVGQHDDVVGVIKHRTQGVQFIAGFLLFFFRPAKREHCDPP